MKRTTKRIITISSVLVVILALLCTGVSLYINSIFDRIEKIPEVSRVDPSNEFFETDSPEESPTTAPVVKPEDIGWGEIEPFLDDKLINILLVGQDRYVGTARQRSDTMLLCSINPETKKVSMISFLRDLYVQIPGGYSDNRLNAAYAFGSSQSSYRKRWMPFIPILVLRSMAALKSTLPVSGALLIFLMVLMSH